MSKIYLSFILAILSLNVFANTADRKSEMILRQSKTNISNPLELRDPFKMPPMKRKKRIDETRFETSQFTNLKSIDNIPLENIRIVGILLGKERRAVARIVGTTAGDQANETYILKEGMNLGLNKAEIKAILPGGIVLVEKITNVYDEEEYLETIIPVSSE